MSKSRYFLATPVKNEEENLPNLIHSVAEQTIKPVLWIIVDDGSTDNSPKIIEDATNRYAWVKSVRLKESPRDLTIHFASVIKTGLDFASEYCREHRIQYDYICFLDADMIIQDKDFFKKIIAEFENDYRLGIASGSIQVIDDGKVKEELRREDTASGGEMVCRRECFEDVGGFPFSYSADSVLCVKAKLRGWEIKQFKAVKIIQTRRTSSAEGFWKGYLANGKADYFLNYNPIFAILKGIKYLTKKPYYIGLAYLIAYFGDFISRRPKIRDEEIRYYYKYIRPKEIINYYRGLIKEIFKVLRRRLWQMKI